MTNYEWLIKNWDKKIDNSNKTVGQLFSFKSTCTFIAMKYCEMNGSCSKCVYTWLHSEASKDTNRLFDDVQEQSNT